MTTPSDDEERWGLLADELELTDPRARAEFFESLGQMQRGEGRVVRPEELRGDTDEELAQRWLQTGGREPTEAERAADREFLRQIHHDEAHEADPETHFGGCFCCCDDCDADEEEGKTKA